MSGAEEKVRCHNPFCCFNRGCGAACGGGAHGCTADAALVPGLVTEHFISVRGGDQLKVRNHYLDVWNAAGVCLSITAWLRMIEPLRRARGKETRKKKNICSEQSDFSNLPLRNTRSFDLRGENKTTWRLILISKHAHSREGESANNKKMRKRGARSQKEPK